jgi:hypothetical protein
MSGVLRIESDGPIRNATMNRPDEPNAFDEVTKEYRAVSAQLGSRKR